jgi:SAM-dependent methyltransferase
MHNSPYTDEFFETIRNGSKCSAKVIAPIVLRLIQPKSIVDIGCGDGSWLSVFRELGVNDVVGLDGNYVDRRMLQIPDSCFVAMNLISPFTLSRTFDLAISLEVAEHLPANSAEGFVDSLTKLAPVILFSAAIPLQGGTNHLNEQWPDYWANLFKSKEYLPIDCIRDRIWRNEQVEWFYAQNIMIFASAKLIHNNAILRQEHEKTKLEQLALVHPKRFLQPAQPGVRGALKLLLKAVTNAIWRI